MKIMFSPIVDFTAEVALGAVSSDAVVDACEKRELSGFSKVKSTVSLILPGCLTFGALSLGYVPGALASLNANQCGAMHRSIANQTYTQNGNFSTESQIYFSRINAFHAQHPECRDGVRQPTVNTNPLRSPYTNEQRMQIECEAIRTLRGYYKYNYVTKTCDLIGG